jgi:formylglycine-generating enzyme
MTRGRIVWLASCVQLLVLLVAAWLVSQRRQQTDDEPSGARVPAPAPASAPAERPPASAMTLIPAGSYRPFFRGKLEAGVIATRPFLLDSQPVTRAAFLEFVRRRPEWRRSSIKALFAEKSYLSDWPSELDAGSPEEPVLYVSWFAARAFCADQGARLPSVVEWERAASLERPDAEASGSAPFAFAMAGPGAADRQGPLVFGALWEWVSDFDAVPVAGDPSAAERAGSLFCGDGVRSTDARNYGAFLRYSFRSSLKANYALKNLGFRCAKDST